MPWRAVSSLPPEATSAALERDRPTVDLTRLHRSSDVLGLVLAFPISFALSARKTAQVLRQIFGVPLSYQSVLNYAQAAAYYCHAFTHYNFLRPHLALGYRVPVALPELSSITTLQGRWNKILALALAA